MIMNTIMLNLLKLLQPQFGTCREKISQKTLKKDFSNKIKIRLAFLKFQTSLQYLNNLNKSEDQHQQLLKTLSLRQTLSVRTALQVPTCGCTFVQVSILN